MIRKSIIVVAAVVGCIVMSAAGAETWVWAADDSGLIHVLEATSGMSLYSFDPGLPAPIEAMAQVDDEMWITGGDNGAVTVLSIEGALLGEFSLGDVSSPIAALTQADQELWIGIGSTVSRYTLDGTHLEDVYETAGNVAGLAYAYGQVWIADDLSPTLVGLATDLSGNDSSKYVPSSTGEPIASLAAVGRYVGIPCDGEGCVPSIQYDLWATHGGDEITRVYIYDDHTELLETTTGVSITALALVAEVDQSTWICPNDDGDIDLDDFVILKNNFGMESGANCSTGDYDGDGDVDLDDFVVLKQNFGTAAVPEPSSLALLAVAALGLRCRRRTRAHDKT